MRQPGPGHHPDLIRACEAEVEFCERLGQVWTMESFNQWLLEQYGVEYINDPPFLAVHDPAKYTLMLLKWPGD
jgi:hypothetical protein